MLLQDDLAVTPAGTWMDQFSCDRQPVAKTIPVSILYHLAGAFVEVLRHVEGDDRPAL